MKHKLSFPLIILSILIAASCTGEEQNTKGLKDALNNKFFIGTAVNASQIMGRDTSSLEVIDTHFNSIVAENCMKSGRIHPKKDAYDFRLPDKFVEFGEQNDMYIVGHCLIWHSQAPRWFFTDDEGNDVSREELIERMKSHISTVVGRYKGKVDCWDVVNEAFEDNGEMRKTKFLKIIGEDYLELAFQFAHEADPEAELLYNDYSMFHEGRRNAVIELVKNLQEKEIQINGIGMQAHYGLDYPDIEAFEASIMAFAEAGMDVHITELDINVLPNPSRNMGAEISTNVEYQKQLNPYAEGLPDSISIALNDRYREFFDLFLEHQDKIKRVTLWGVADHHSWKNNWPVRGRTNYPLLFNRDYSPKPVVKDIIESADQL